MDETINELETGNTLFVINQCNSNCIMCPDTDHNRRLPNNITIEDLTRRIDSMDSKSLDVIITGGEPTLLKTQLYNMIFNCYKKMPDVKVTLLTNGRAFADKGYSELFKPFRADKFIVEIPIHGYNPETHDRITQSAGSFEQTIAGTRNIMALGIPVSIRIVLSKLNSDYLIKICEYLVKEFPQLVSISIMGLEMLGSAYKYRDKVWVDFQDVKEVLENSIEICFRGGITPQIYNFPLCLFQEKFWVFYRKSITPSKISYKPQCQGCSMKSQCGGFFFSTIRHTNFQVKPFD